MMLKIFSERLTGLQQGTDYILKFTKIEIETSLLSSEILAGSKIRRQTEKAGLSEIQGVILRVILIFICLTVTLCEGCQFFFSVFLI